MRVRIKRCEVCASKLDKDGNCTWSECPKCPKYKVEVKDEANPKAKTTNS
nr:MAG TPA: DNA-directed RNA polymerase [Caudoviricetes sp.]